MKNSRSMANSKPLFLRKICKVTQTLSGLFSQNSSHNACQIQIAITKYQNHLQGLQFSELYTSENPQNATYDWFHGRGSHVGYVENIFNLFGDVHFVHDTSSNCGRLLTGRLSTYWFFREYLMRSTTSWRYGRHQVTLVPTSQSSSGEPSTAWWPL